MSETPADNTRDDDAVQSDSLNVETIVIDGPGDHTIRPMSETLRKILEQKGVIKPRPVEPQIPPTNSAEPPS